MDSVRSSLSGPTGTFVRVFFILLAFYILYVVYQFLFGTSDMNDYQTNPAVEAGIPINKPEGIEIVNIKGQNPRLFQVASGGDFSISFWVYVQTISRGTKNQFILSLGGNPLTEDQSLLVYLGANKFSLKVRTNARATDSDPNPLTSANVTALFNTPPQISTQQNEDAQCDINSLDLQKWNHVAIVYTSKTLDVYVNGKLARSCILPGIIKFATTYKLNLYALGGFGGYLSQLTTHDYSLNPEQVWRIYMAGPGPKYTLTQYLTSLFDPQAVSSLEYPDIPTASGTQ